MSLPQLSLRQAGCLWILLLAFTAGIADAAPRHESGTVAVTQISSTTWQAVTFQTPFAAAPVVIVGPPSWNEMEPTTMRVRNVTTTGFEFQLDEWDYLNGVHAEETLSWLAFEPGVHSVSGKTWEAGRAANVNATLRTVRLAGRFPAAPVILAQRETANDSRGMAVRVRGVTRSSFQLRLQTQRVTAGAIVPESVAWLAITAGSGALEGAPYLAARSSPMHTQTWKVLRFPTLYPGAALLGQTQAYDGGEACALRFRNLTGAGVELLVEEEMSRNVERRRATENVGYLVLGAAEAAAKLEVGAIAHDQSNPALWRSVAFDQAYAKPVVVMGPPTFGDAVPATVRVRKVTATGFEFRIENWDQANPSHGPETIGYLVMEEGVFNIGGLRWQAGRKSGVTHAPTAIAFASAFPSTPVVLAQVASANEAAPANERMSAISAAGFTAQLTEAQASDGTHAGEELHFVAIQAGVAQLASTGLRYEARTPIAGFTDQFQQHDFSALFAEPFLLADLQTRNDADPAALRQRSLSSEGVELKIEEETTGDAETVHASEKVGMLVFAGAVDTDGDGLPDAWETANGLDPEDPNDAASDEDHDGLTAFAEHRFGTNPNSFDSAGTVTVAVVEPSAFELGSVPARFRIERSEGTVPATIHFTFSGAATAGTDFQARSASGTVLSGSVDLPFNAASVEVVIAPATDALMEYPESATLTLTAAPNYTIGATGAGSVTIADAPDTSENELLFVAFLNAQDNAETFASGLATLYLNGPRNRARVNLSFSGLTSNQTNAYIRYGVAAGIGPELRPTLPIGQVTNETWNIVPTGAITGQDIVDGLFEVAGKYVYINVGTGTYPAGEIAGIWSRETGSTEFVPPDDPPPITPLAGDALTRDVARFLTQATFGPTHAEIDALVTSINTTHGGNRIVGFNAWIDQQLALDQTKLRDYTFAADAQEWSLRGSSPTSFTNNEEPRHHNRRRGWWLLATKAHDQLRQRAAFALSEIFVISDKETEVRNRHYGAATYYDQLATFASGNYRDLLEAVSKSPMMGKYLSHLKNQKAIVDPDTGDILVSPDENYAREVMQLLSIGLVHRHPDGTLKLGADGLPIATYGNDDITELARVFTGWSFGKRHGSAASGYPVQDNTNFNQGNGPAYFQASWENPMINFAAFHDTGSKVVLGTPIAENLGGEADLDAALNILFNHPNTAPFISRLLIQRLVTSNPSAGYIHRVAQKFANNGSSVRGDMKTVLKAILLDYEARTLELTDNVGYGRQKEPIVRYVQLLRAFNAQSQLPLSDLSAYGYPTAQLGNFPSGTTRLRYPVTDTRLGQTPQGAPTVFNWFLPDFNPGGAIASAGLAAPEMQITTETSVANAINYHYAVLILDNGQGVDALFGSTDGTLDNVRLDRTPLVTMYDAEITAGRTVTQAVTTLLDHLDVLLNAGQLRASYETAPIPNPRSTIIEGVAAMTVNSTNRIKELLYALATSPAYLHQK